MPGFSNKQLPIEADNTLASRPSCGEEKSATVQDILHQDHKQANHWHRSGNVCTNVLSLNQPIYRRRLVRRDATRNRISTNHSVAVNRFPAPI
jgi:hypothetical protein